MSLLLNISQHSELDKQNRVIFRINDVDARTVTFLFFKNINLGNTKYQVFEYSYQDKKGYFIFNMSSKKGSIIEESMNISGWKNDNIISIGNKNIDVSLLDFKDLTIIK